VELDMPGAISSELTITRLRWTDAVPALPVVLERRQGKRFALRWRELSDRHRHQLILWLFCRPGCWPDRQAPPEWKAFMALISRLLTLPARRPFHRCLTLQTPPQ
tara:strand:- start:122 stop:436 length:315 start_codon:yes stop_codon:yes gene_type:complete